MSSPILSILYILSLNLCPGPFFSCHPQSCLHVPCFSLFFWPFMSCLVLSCPVLSCSVLFCSVLFCPVLSFPVLSCTFRSCPVLFCSVLSYFVLSCPVLSFPVLSCPFLFFPILSCPVLSYFVMSCSLMFCHILSGWGTPFFSIWYIMFFSILKKEHSVLFRSFLEFLATYETQKNVLFFSVLF